MYLSNFKRELGGKIIIQCKPRAFIYNASKYLQRTTLFKLHLNYLNGIPYH